MVTDRVGVGPRALAVIIDMVAFIIISCCLGIVLAMIGDNDMGSTSGPSIIANCGVSLLMLGYFILLEANSGQTLGKKVVKIKVVKEDGSPITMGDSVVRNVLRIVDGFFFYLVGAIFIWTNPSKQRLGDKLAKTIVVGVGPTNQESQTPEPPLPRF